MWKKTSEAMTELHLPSFPMRLKGSQEKPLVFDRLRHKYVALTPEERVRQYFVNFLIEHKGYPPTLLANEVSLQIGGKVLRADTVLYGKDLHARMILEYKAPSIPISKRVFEQISAYNTLLHVDYLVVSNGLKHYCCMMDCQSRKLIFLEDIPRYEEIIQKDCPL